jgi:WD40 repeat protein
VAFSPGGRLLAVGGQEQLADAGKVHLLDPATGRLVRAFSAEMGPGSPVARAVSALAFSPDGKMLAVGSWSTRATLWDLTTGRKPHTLKHAVVVTSLAFTPDGRRLVTATADGMLRLWDVATGRELLALRGPGQDTRVAFSPDGRRLAAGANPRGVMVWEAASKEAIAARAAQERAAAR